MKDVALFVAGVLVLQALLFLLHVVIYETLAAAFGIGGFVTALVLAALSLTFISASFLAAWASGFAVRLYYRFAAVWFAFIAPLCGASAGFVVIENISLALGRGVIAPPVVGAVSFGAAVLLALYGIWNSSRLRVTKLIMHLPNVPEKWQGRRLIFFSDVHLGNLRGEGFTKKIVEKVRTLDPSLVAIGGDLFDGTMCDAQKLVAPLKELRPPLGIYFVSGNHEYIRDTEYFFDAVRREGIRVLRSERVDAGGIDLVGADWQDAEKRNGFAAIMDSMHLDKGRIAVLLKHEPDDPDVASRAGIDLQLSGHTHGGQFWPISLATHYLYKGLDYGFHRVGEMALYTSSGTGTWMSPFRFGTKAEIVSVEFRLSAARNGNG